MDASIIAEFQVTAHTSTIDPNVVGRADDDADDDVVASVLGRAPCGDGASGRVNRESLAGTVERLARRVWRERSQVVQIRHPCHVVILRPCRVDGSRADDLHHAPTCQRTDGRQGKYQGLARGRLRT